MAYANLMMEPSAKNGHTLGELVSLVNIKFGSLEKENLNSRLAFLIMNFKIGIVAKFI